MSERLEPISCNERESLISSPLPGCEFSPISSLTNYVGGEVLDHRLPAMTVTTWSHHNGLDYLRDELDEDGCRHFIFRVSLDEITQVTS